MADPDPTSLLSIDPAELSDEGVRRHVVALHHLIGRAQAAAVAATGVLDGRKVWAGDLARSASAWLVPRTGVMPHEARRDVEIGRALRSMPVVAAAFAAGVLTRVKAGFLVDVRTPELEDIFAEHEAWLVETVAGLTTPQARTFLAGWQQQARLAVGSIDPDGPDPSDAPSAALSLTQTFDGRFVLDGEMDVANGSTMRSILDAEIDHLFNTGVYGKEDGLTPAERRGLAHMQILLRNGRVGIKNGEIRPSIEVVTDLKTLLGLPITDAADLRSRRCETRSGHPVSFQTLARLACEAVCHIVVTDGKGHVLDVGHAFRYATRRQKRALAHQHRGCQFPGCSAPAQWCDAHHITDWSLGGPTDMANLALLCPFHHHRTHADGYRLSTTPDGTLEVQRPDGTRIERCRPDTRRPGLAA
jgi:hypothetical protein